jgi:hypothetical protein
MTAFCYAIFTKEVQVKKSTKAILIILLFLLGGVCNFFLSPSLDIALTAHITPTWHSIDENLNRLVTVESCRKMYLLIQILIGVLAVFLIAIQRKPYQSQEIPITNTIKIPAPAGQGQHGSSWFMSKKDKRKSFQTFDVCATDSGLAKLFKYGDKLFKETVKYAKTHNINEEKPKKAKTEPIQEVQENPKPEIIENTEISEREWRREMHRQERRGKMKGLFKPFFIVVEKITDAFHAVQKFFGKIISVVTSPFRKAANFVKSVKKSIARRKRRNKRRRKLINKNIRLKFEPVTDFFLDLFEPITKRFKKDVE